MTTSKEEALKRLDELEKKVDELAEERDNLKLAYETISAKLPEAQKVVDDLKKESKKLAGQVVDLSAEKAQLERKLEGYSALDKALGQIKAPGGVTLEQVRAVVREEIAGIGPVVAASPGEVSTEMPELIVNVDRPDVVAEDTSLKGGIAILLSEGYFDKQRSAGNVKTKLNSIGLENSEKDIMSELTRFCQWRLLEAAHTDRWLYSVAAGAKERVKLR